MTLPAMAKMMPATVSGSAERRGAARPSPGRAEMDSRIPNTAKFASMAVRP